RYTSYPIYFHLSLAPRLVSILSSTRAYPLPCLPSFPTRRSSDLYLFLSNFGKNVVSVISNGLKNISSTNVGKPSCVTSSISLYRDRKSTRLNSSHVSSSYAVFCVKKKKQRRNKV